jgi:uncharacterized membrane protein
MHATQAAKSISGNAHALEVRQLNPAGIAHNHKLNVVVAVLSGVQRVIAQQVRDIDRGR